MADIQNWTQNGKLFPSFMEHVDDACVSLLERCQEVMISKANPYDTMDFNWIYSVILAPVLSQ
jgi:hypothetical protein